MHRTERVNMFEHNESQKSIFIKSEARKIVIIYFPCKVCKKWKFPFIFILIVKFQV